MVAGASLLGQKAVPQASLGGGPGGEDSEAGEQRRFVLFLKGLLQIHLEDFERREQRAPAMDPPAQAIGEQAPGDSFLLHPPHEGRRLVEIPVSWVLDDAPFFLFTGQRAIQPPGPVLQGWLTELDGITEVGGVTNFTFHPQIIGRPSRFACLRELVEHARHTPKLWLARLDQIAAHARAEAA